METTKQEKEYFPFGIAMCEYCDDEEIEELKKEVRENDEEIEEETLKRLKKAFIFRLDENIRYSLIEADIVMIDVNENECFVYYTGHSDLIHKVENKNIVALMNDEDVIML